MKKYGINMQWDKKNSIVPLLPDEVVQECKPILRLTEEEAGTSIYKDLKTEIMSLYGPRQEDIFKKASALKMTGKPSALGKQLVHVLCPGSKPFEGCHCAPIVFGFWDAQLTPPIRTKLAGREFNINTYKELFKLADEAWLANGGATSTPAVVAAVSGPSSPSNPPTSAADQIAALTTQVAALSRGRGRGARGNRGGRGNRGNNSSSGGSGRGQNNQNQNNNSSNSSNSNKPHQKGQKHSDLPSNASWACAQHWKKGRGAPYCSDPLVCEWSQVVAPRTSSSNNS